MIVKPISIKGAKRRFGGRAWKAVELTSGGLLRVPESGLGVSRGILTAQQKSAVRVVASESGERRRIRQAPLGGVNGSGK